MYFLLQLSLHNFTDLFGFYNLITVAAAEVGDLFLHGTVQLGRGESKRCRRAAQEVHPGTACSPAHLRIRQHLQRCQRSVAFTQ